MQDTQFNSVASIIYSLGMTESGLVFLIFWNKFGNFNTREENVGAETPPVENGWFKP